MHGRLLRFLSHLNLSDLISTFLSHCHILQIFCTPLLTSSNAHSHMAMASPCACAWQCHGQYRFWGAWIRSGVVVVGAEPTDSYKSVTLFHSVGQHTNTPKSKPGRLAIRKVLHILLSKGRLSKTRNSILCKFWLFNKTRQFLFCLLFCSGRFCCDNGQTQSMWMSNSFQLLSEWIS